MIYKPNPVHLNIFHLLNPTPLLHAIPLPAWTYEEALPIAIGATAIAGVTVIIRTLRRPPA